MSSSLHIALLADYPEHLATLCAWSEAEWRDYYGPQERCHAYSAGTLRRGQGSRSSLRSAWWYSVGVRKPSR